MGSKAAKHDIGNVDHSNEQHIKACQQSRSKQRQMRGKGKQFTDGHPVKSLGLKLCLS